MSEKRICRRVLPGEAELCPLPRGHRWPCDDERSKLTAKFNAERAEHLARLAERDEALVEVEHLRAALRELHEAVDDIQQVADTGPRGLHRVAKAMERARVRLSCSWGQVTESAALSRENR